MSARRGRADSEAKKWCLQNDEEVEPYTVTEVNNAVATYSKQSWDSQIRTLERLRGSLHDSQAKAAIVQHLRPLVSHIVATVNSPRSMLAVASVHTVNAFAIVLGPKLDPDLQVLIPTLLSKLIESSKGFLCDDAASALAAIVARCTPRKTVAVLLQQRDPKSQGKQTGISWLLYQTLLHHGDTLVAHLPMPLTIPAYHQFLVQLNQDPAGLVAELASSGAPIPATPRLTSSSSTGSLLGTASGSGMHTSGLRSARNVPPLDLEALPETQQLSRESQGLSSTRSHRAGSHALATPRTPSAHPRTPRSGAVATTTSTAEGSGSTSGSPSGTAIKVAHHTLCLVTAAVATFAEDRSSDARLWAARALLLLHVLLSPIAAIRAQRLPPLPYAPPQSQHYANLNQPYAADDVTRLLKPIDLLLAQDPGSLPGGVNNPYAFPLDCLIAIAVAEDAAANSGLASSSSSYAASSALVGSTSFTSSSSFGGGGSSLGQFSYSSSVGSFSTSTSLYGGGGVPTNTIIQTAVANALTGVHRLLSSRDWKSEFLSVINDRQEVNPTGAANSVSRAEARLAKLNSQSHLQIPDDDDHDHEADGPKSARNSARSASPTRLLHARSASLSARRRMHNASTGSASSDLGIVPVPERKNSIAEELPQVEPDPEPKLALGRSVSTQDFVDDLFNPDTPTSHNTEAIRTTQDKTQNEVEEVLEIEVTGMQQDEQKLPTSAPTVEVEVAAPDFTAVGATAAAGRASVSNDTSVSSSSARRRSSGGYRPNSYLELYRMSLPPDHPDSLASPDHAPDELDETESDHEEKAPENEVARRTSPRPRTGGPNRPVSQRLASVMATQQDSQNPSDTGVLPFISAHDPQIQEKSEAGLGLGTSSLTSRLKLLRSRNLRSATTRNSVDGTETSATQASGISIPDPRGSTSSSIGAPQTPTQASKGSGHTSGHSELQMSAARLALLSSRHSRRSSNASNASQGSLVSSVSSSSVPSYKPSAVSNLTSMPSVLTASRRLPDGPITASIALEHSHSVQVGQMLQQQQQQQSQDTGGGGGLSYSTSFSEIDPEVASISGMSVASSRTGHVPGSASVLARLAARMQNQHHSMAHIPQAERVIAKVEPLPKPSSVLSHLHQQQHQQHQEHPSATFATPLSEPARTHSTDPSTTSHAPAPATPLSSRARLQLLSSRVRANATPSSAQIQQ